MTKATWQRAVAHRLGISNIEITTTRIGQTLHMPCARGHLVDVEVPPGRPPEMIATKMLNAGWTIGRKSLCPEHGRKNERPEAEQPIIEQEEVTMATNQIAGGVAPPPPPVGTKASPAAGKAKRLVYMALEDYYDEPGKRYKPGHSDASIAKACGGISEAAVKAIREESYGPLGEPADLTEFRDALKDCRTKISENGDAMRLLVRALELKLDRLVKANGWAE